jgi:hypothetical protein
MADTIRFVFFGTGSRDGRTVLFDHNAGFRMRELVEQWNRTRKTAPELQPLPARVRFVHFDYDSMKIRAYEHLFEEKKTTAPRVKQWDELSAFSSTAGAAADDPKTFVDTSTVDANNGQKKVLSITNIYHSVRGAPKGSVLEVGVFSHGFVEGPVVINTSDTGASATRRASDDCDGRAAKDFLDNMGEDPAVSASGTVKSGGKNALKEFKEKLAPQFSLRVYGCNAQDVVPGTRQLLRAAALSVINESYNAHPSTMRGSKPPADDLEFKLDMWNATLNEGAVDKSNNWNSINTAARNAIGNDLLASHRKLDPNFFPVPNSDINKPPAVTKVTVKWADVRRFLANKIKETYIFKAAEQLTPLGVNVSCHAAVPGVGGNNEARRDGLGQMRVCFAENKAVNGCDDAWGTILVVYRNFMKVKLDDRNYAIFDADAVTAINDFAKP